MYTAPIIRMAMTAAVVVNAIIMTDLLPVIPVCNAIYIDILLTQNNILEFGINNHKKLALKQLHIQI